MASWPQQELQAMGYISATDFQIFERVDSADEAVKIINDFYGRYHSLRYIGDRLVIRLKSMLDPQRIVDLKVRFSDILMPHSEVVLSGPLPQETDEPEIDHLPRLVIQFSRKDFGRLTAFIKAINED